MYHWLQLFVFCLLRRQQGKHLPQRRTSLSITLHTKAGRRAAHCQSALSTVVIIILNEWPCCRAGKVRFLLFSPRGIAMPSNSWRCRWAYILPLWFFFLLFWRLISDVTEKISTNIADNCCLKNFVRTSPGNYLPRAGAKKRWGWPHWNFADIFMRQKTRFPVHGVVSVILLQAIWYNNFVCESINLYTWQTDRQTDRHTTTMDVSPWPWPGLKDYKCRPWPWP